MLLLKDLLESRVNKVGQVIGVVHCNGSSLYCPSLSSDVESSTLRTMFNTVPKL